MLSAIFLHGILTINLQCLFIFSRYLHIAVVRTDRFMIQALLERLHREHLMNLVDKENNQRQTPLFLAVAINEPVKVQLLVKAGANVNTFAQVSKYIITCCN